MAARPARGLRSMEAAAAAPVRRWLQADGADPTARARKLLGQARPGRVIAAKRRGPGSVTWSGESQLKEVEKMLKQDGLSKIPPSNDTDQIAYLLVERTTLLEVADEEQNACSHKGRLCAAQLQDEVDPIHQTSEDEHEQRDLTQLMGETTTGLYREELEREQASRARVERDLGEAMQRLLMAQEEIQRLTDELDAQRKEQNETETALWSALQAPEGQEREVTDWRVSAKLELDKAMEHSSRLDKEILALRARVQTLDLERKAFLDLVEQLKEEFCEYQKSEKQGLPLPVLTETEEATECLLQTRGTTDEGRVEGDCVSGKAASDQEERHQGSETLHKRCRQVIENVEGRSSQLLHKLQKLEEEHEDLVEHNEELESILRETQIQTKQEKEQFGSEVEGLHWKITSLQTELLEVQKNKAEMSGEEQVSPGAQEMQEMLESCQETIEKLGSQLGERRERRKQLASELELLREDLKAEQKVLDSQVHVSELLQERGQMSNLEQKHEDVSTDEETDEEQMAKGLFLEEQIKNLRDEQELLCSELLESNKKREELEKQLKETKGDKQLLLEEITLLKQGILSTQEQDNSTLGGTLRMNQGTTCRDSGFLVSQSSAVSVDGSVPQGLSDERFQQQEEKMHQLRQDLRRVQNLCSSAERELRYQREKNGDLQKQNLLLQQECTKVKAELKQTQAKLSDTTETCSSLSAQWEKSQQKVKELEQELLKCSQADKLQSGLQEKLAQEKSKLCEAQKKISKLQQKLKDSQHQLLLAEARASDKKLQEEELKDARDSEARVQQELHEEQLKRKLLEQQVEELRQQLRHSRETEALLAKMHMELQAKTLHVLEDERKTDSSEHLQCQKENQKLAEQLTLLKEENKALYEEGVHLLNQKDLYVRKYNRVQLRHKDRMRRAKETFVHEVKQRDSRIRQLENELSEAKLQVEKGKMLIAQITAENEKLLQERRRLLQKVTDQEETPWNNQSTAATLQSSLRPVPGMDAQSREKDRRAAGEQLKGGTKEFQLLQHHQDWKGVNFSQRQLQSKMLPSLRPSFLPRELPDSVSTMKATQDMKPEGEAESQDSSFCLSPSQPSEIGYLNVASPGDTTASQLPEESRSITSENF